MTAIGVAAALVGLGFALLGHQALLGDKRWILTRAATPPATSQVYCGQLLTHGEDGALTLRPLDEDNGLGATPIAYPAQAVAEYTALEQTNLCP